MTAEQLEANNVSVGTCSAWLYGLTHCKQEGEYAQCLAVRALVAHAQYVLDRSCLGFACW